MSIDPGVIGVLIAFIVALGGVVGFFIKRMDNYTPRREFDQHVDSDREHVPRPEFAAVIEAQNKSFASLEKRFDSLHETTHEIRNYLMKLRPAVPMERRES